jgi:hypothetical protein
LDEVVLFCGGVLSSVAFVLGWTEKVIGSGSDNEQKNDNQHNNEASFLLFWSYYLWLLGRGDWSRLSFGWWGR